MGWHLRDGDDLETCFVPQYFSNNNLFTIELHHGGKFIWGKKTKYLYGKIDHIDYCNPTEISCLSIVEMCAEAGSYGVQNIYYKSVDSDFLSGLAQLKHNCDTHLLVKAINISRVVEVYCEGVCDSEDSDNTEYINSDTDDNVTDSDLESFSGSDEEKGIEDDFGLESSVIKRRGRKKEKGKKVATTKTKHVPGKKSSIFGGVSHGGRAQGQGISMGFVGSVIDDGYVPFNDLNSDCDSDEENNRLKGKSVFCKLDLNHVEFKLGMKFDTGKDFRHAVKRYAVQQAKDLRFKKNCKGKMIVCCIKTCPWYLYASKNTDEQTVQVKTYYDDHNCPRALQNRNAKPRFIGELYAKMVMLNPKWDTKFFHAQVESDLELKITVGCAYRAMKHAKRINEGNSAEQYALLWDYLAEIRRTNVGTTAILEATPKAGPLGESRFERLYICWGALKRGFLQGCRPLIGVDGCHLTGPQRGVLLTAVAIDANNCLYPFAYAVVDVENYNNWLWFLELLKIDLQMDNDEAYTLMSDKQKGLIKVVEEIMPNIEHRFCVRHLYNNFKTNHKGISLKNLLWKAARASTMYHFNGALEEMRVMEPGAYEWLSSKPGKNWSRSHFSTHSKCEFKGVGVKSPIS